MSQYTLRKGITCLAVGLVVGTQFAVPAVAQIEHPSAVSITLEQADLRSTLKQLFESQKLNYTLDNGVRGTVTSTLKNVPFTTALDTLLRTANAETPLSYRVERGIYSIFPKSEDQRDTKSKQVAKFELAYNSAESMVEQLKKMTPFRESSNLSYQALPTQNAIVVNGFEENIEALREGIRLLDVQSRHVIVKAELIYVADGKKDKRRVIWAPSVTGNNNQEMSIKTDVQNGVVTTWSGGSNSLKIKPRVNGDGSISLDAEWNADIILKIEGQTEPIHVKHNASGAVRAASGNTVVLTGAVIKLGGKAPDAELLLFLTPTIIEEDSKK